VSDEQHVNAVHDSNRLPTPLALHLPILPREVLRIVKDQGSGLKPDAVLSSVELVLSFVPDKFHGQPFVMANMYIQ